MDPTILLFFGGVGLFLLGMLVLTDGLQGLAGDALRRGLARFTKNPSSGAMAGAAATAIVQSSSATTVATIGFVGAGLLTFSQALGIIFGANIGTTITGWFVAILGFKFDLGTVVLPLVFLGVLIKIFGRGKVQHAGWALAGFSLLFIGIDAMQQGLAPFEGDVTPDNFPDDTWFGRIQLVLIGALITLVTQSSSAGVATTLVAMQAGTISFTQAAAMIIGMDIGTTFTAALAALGGSTARRQTGYAHVIYNVMTGVMAFFLLTPFAALVDAWIANGGKGNAQISLVAFHTTFNTLGVLLVLPFAKPFARFIVWLVPEGGPPLLRRLDDRLLKEPAAAVEAVIATVGDIARELFDLLIDLLDPTRSRRPDPMRLRAVGQALEVTGAFVEQIRTDPSLSATHQRHLAAMHALDHLNRLHHRCGQRARIRVLASEHRLRRLSGLLLGALSDERRRKDPLQAERVFERLRALLHRRRTTYRRRTVAAASSKQISARTALARLDSVRWLHRATYHVWRILFHMAAALETPPGEALAGPLDTEKEPDIAEAEVPRG